MRKLTFLPTPSESKASMGRLVYTIESLRFQ
jgi:hypothetical protein